MDTLTLCRKVADIDGWSGVDTITNVGALSAVVDGKGGVMGKALLWDLMVKHKVELDYYNGETVTNNCKIYAVDCELIGDVEFLNEDKLPRVILECIIQANEQKGDQYEQS